MFAFTHPPRTALQKLLIKLQALQPLQLGEQRVDAAACCAAAPVAAVACQQLQEFVSEEVSPAGAAAHGVSWGWQDSVAATQSACPPWFLFGRRLPATKQPRPAWQCLTGWPPRVRLAACLMSFAVEACWLVAAQHVEDWQKLPGDPKRPSPATALLCACEIVLQLESKHPCTIKFAGSGARQTLLCGLWGFKIRSPNYFQTLSTATLTVV